MAIRKKSALPPSTSDPQLEEEEQRRQERRVLHGLELHCLERGIGRGEFLMMVQVLGLPHLVIHRVDPNEFVAEYKRNRSGHKVKQ